MRCVLAFWGCLTLLTTMGCAMCASPYDRSYAAYGGRIQRTDRVHGRVGSILDPGAGTYAAAEDASMLVPTPADEQVEGEEPSVEPVPWQPDRPAPQEPTPAEPPESATDQDGGLPTVPERTDAAPPQLPEIPSDASGF